MQQRYVADTNAWRNGSTGSSNVAEVDEPGSRSGQQPLDELPKFNVQVPGKLAEIRPENVHRLIRIRPPLAGSFVGFTSDTRFVRVS